MDILIKNIGGLPKDDDLTLTITPKGEIILGRSIFTYTLGEEVRAIELPPHGRLGDLDKVEDEIMDSSIRDWLDALGVVRRASTIVEAST